MRGQRPPTLLDGDWTCKQPVASVSQSVSISTLALPALLHPVPPCHPTTLPGHSPSLPVPPPCPTYSSSLAGTGRRRRRRGGGPSQRCICNLWEGRMHWQASQDRLDANMLGPECFLTKVWTSLSPRLLATAG